MKELQGPSQVMHITALVIAPGERRHDDRACMLLLMNSLKESSCWRTRPLASKYAEMTVQASSCTATIALK